MRKAYIEKRFRDKSLELIEVAEGILEDYLERGYDLTLRQLYYQFVSKNIIENTEAAYKRLSSLIVDARLAGLLRWDVLVDRTRNVIQNDHWNNPEEILKSAIASYRIDHWQNQEENVQVWIEKDALMGVISRPCEEMDVPYFACKGYNSQSEMWDSGTKIFDEGKPTTILYLGDHDPSGIDMTRDVRDRLLMFTFDSGLIEVKRIALNMDQIEDYNLPPNPAKMTDVRSPDYIKKYGRSSWELDALDPDVLAGMVGEAIEEIRDDSAYKKILNRENRERNKLKKLLENV